MQLQKISGITGEKTENIGPDKAALRKNAQPLAASASIPRPAAGAMPALIAAAGLPADRLSAAIVLFARFFSLPLKPETMAAIRRQAFAPVNTPPAAAQADSAQQAENAEAAARNRQALSLAAAAAESKGAELSQKGLEAYAGAVDPDWQRRGSRDRGRERKGQDRQEDESPSPKTGADMTLSAGELREMALESEAKDPLLAILNRLPCKNGRRWLVFPLNFTKGGRDFSVRLRILLEQEGPSRTAGQIASQMVLDIAENGRAGRRWLFAAEAAGSTLCRLAVFLEPGLPPRPQARLVRELSSLMEIPPGQVTIKGFDGAFPFEANCGDGLLQSVNKAV